MIERIISGGQSGADRGGLDFAIEFGIPHGGWCPRGRLAEDGPIPSKYELVETRTNRYPYRTLKNIQDSDATVIFLSGSSECRGSQLTIELARREKKPHIVLHQEDGEVDCAAKLLKWIDEHPVRVLNIAGPRESKVTGIHDFVVEVLRRGIKMSTEKWYSSRFRVMEDLVDDGPTVTDS